MTVENPFDAGADRSNRCAASVPYARSRSTPRAPDQVAAAAVMVALRINETTAAALRISRLGLPPFRPSKLTSDFLLLTSVLKVEPYPAGLKYSTSDAPPATSSMPTHSIGFGGTLGGCRY